MDGSLKNLRLMFPPNRIESIDSQNMNIASQVCGIKILEDWSRL